MTDNKISTIDNLKRCAEGNCGDYALSYSAYCHRHTQNVEEWCRLLLQNVCTTEPAPPEQLFLFSINASGTNLRTANLPGAELTRADLSSSCLARANLAGANLSESNLHHTDFLGANLSNVDFFGADLRSAIFTDADLSGAKFHEADLTGADFRGARNLDKAFLHKARLSGTMIDHEIFATAEENIGDLIAAESVYREWKSNFDRSGDFKKADAADLSANKVQLRSLYNQALFNLNNLYPEQLSGGRAATRKLFKKYGRYSRTKYIKYLKKRFWDLFFGFGHKPLRLAWWSVIWVAIWTLLNHVVGYTDSLYFNFRRALYGFLGVGGDSPYMSFVFAEAIGGIFIFASFIYILLRRIVR